MKSFRILGIDPGSQKSGVAVLDVQGNRLKHVFHTVVRVHKLDFDQRLYRLFDEVSAIIEQYKPDTAAIEDVFVSNNVSSALKLGQARGALITACGHHGLRAHAYSPTQIKQAVTGFGRADKDQIQHMIKVLLRPPGKLAEDAADALAVCICHAHHAPMQSLLNKPKTSENGA